MRNHISQGQILILYAILLVDYRTCYNVMYENKFV